MYAKTIITVALVGFLIGTTQAYAPEIEDPPPAIEDPPPAKEWMDATVLEKVGKLIECESGGKNVTIVDTNGELSAGILQFQLPTFKHYMTRYSLAPAAEPHELENLWKDSDLQWRLAYEMIKENPNNLRHWHNCSTKMNLY